jgi:flagellar hook-associated protein 1 FlgK
MSLTAAFQIGRSGLTTSQVGIQVTGNNLANAGTAGYSRQTTTIQPIRDGFTGRLYTGRGAEVTSIRRQADAALDARVRSGLSSRAGAQADLALLGDVEQTLNALGDNNLSSQLNAFFGSWSELANTPNQAAARSLVVQSGRTMAASVRSIRETLVAQRTQIDRDLQATVSQADDLLRQFVAVNQQVIAAESAGAPANNLRDQRDTVLNQLAELLPISTAEQARGGVDVFVGSTPLVLGGESRGLRLVQEVSAPVAGAQGEVTVRVAIGPDEQTLSVGGGRVGALLGQRSGAVDDAIDRLDQLTAHLVSVVNRAHSTGFGLSPLTSVTGQLRVGAADRTRAFNDPTNATFAALPVGPVNGSFLVSVTNTATGASQTRRVTIDLDGLNNAGAPGFADDTSLASLAADLNTTANLSASVTAAGELRLDAAAGFKVTFSEDSSGALAALGVNTFFTGTTAADISVRADLVADPSRLSTGGLVNGEPVDNAAALAVLAGRDGPIAALGNQTLGEFWDATTQGVGTRAASAKNAADAATLVSENLQAQRDSVSGVSVDEESINLITYQRQFQASARFISVVDELTQNLLSILR